MRKKIGVALMQKTLDKKTAYEWVLTTFNGDELYLTEKQYAVYKTNQEGGKLFFDTFEVNPSAVASGYKREAYELKKKYTCPECLATGMKLGEVCDKCEGTGLNI
jgi:DnaJ-class molecular chaperone